MQPCRYLSSTKLDTSLSLENQTHGAIIKQRWLIFYNQAGIVTEMFDFLRDSFSLNVIVVCVFLP